MNHCCLAKGDRPQFIVPLRDTAGLQAVAMHFDADEQVPGEKAATYWFYHGGRAASLAQSGFSLFKLSASWAKEPRQDRFERVKDRVVVERGRDGLL